MEKDYYVTLILKLPSDQLAECVFKGGTSLSKGFHVIDCCKMIQMKKGRHSIYCISRLILTSP